MLAAEAGPILDWAVGDQTALPIPAHRQAFLQGGAEWLTQAFRRFGSLDAQNRVERIANCTLCPGGSTGSKLLVTVDYARDQPGLERELFVKFSRDFSDPRRDRQRTEMASEAAFAAVSRSSGFPIEVPLALFADYDRASGSGLVISECIRFGEGGVEPHRRKCLDHLTMPEPLPYYRAVITALAKLAAAHKSGQLAGDIDARFPFDPAHGSADPIRASEQELRQQLGDCAAFAARCPQLLPGHVRTPDFQGRMAEDAVSIRQHEAAIQGYLTGNPDLIALNHWNAHIDNCFFRRDAGGGLHCGLLDWGRAGQLTFGAVLWGALSAAHHTIWREHLDELLALFVLEYVDHGGPAITAEALKLHLTLHVATMGVARCLVFPEVVLFRLPEAVDASGPLDPMFEAVDPARNSLHIYTVLLEFWQREDFGAALRRILDADEVIRAR